MKMKELKSWRTVLISASLIIIFICNYGYAQAADSDGDGYTILQGDCNDSDAAVYPGAAEICDGKDNDCNLSTADGSGESWLGNACDGNDTDLCAEGVFTCSNGAKSCTDNTVSTVEICDGLDNDCDGSIDENLGTTTCGYGVCQRIVNSCINGQVQACTPGSPTEAMESTCNDGLDNDCDSRVDMSDPNCWVGDSAVDLSNGASSINSSSLPSLANKEITVEAWVKSKSSNLNGGILSRYGNSSVAAMWAKNNELKFGINPHATSTPLYIVRSLGSIMKNIWYHIAGVLVNQNHSHPESTNCTASVMAETPHLDIYVNGDFKGCASTGRQFISDSSTSGILLFGGVRGQLWNNYGIDGLTQNTLFDGIIDDVRFWTVARTEQEIQQCMYYKLGTVPWCTVDSSKLKGYWTLDEGSGTVITDSSGNGYLGSLGSGAWTTGFSFNDILYYLDTDGDGIFDDGDDSGIVEDNVCTGGNKINCDDNCMYISNSTQPDSDYDGLGDACDIKVYGVGMNSPSSKWRATMSVNVDGYGPSGFVKYYYTRQRMNFISSSITSVTVSGNIVTISGTGNATKDTGTGCSGCFFNITIVGGPPDAMGIEILNPDGSFYYKEPSSGGTRVIQSGNFTIAK